MPDYDDTNRGQIWPNKKKITENHPDFTGSIDVEGKEYWVSAWKRKPDANPKSPSLRFSISEKEDKAPATQDSAPAQSAEFDDDIPF